MAVKKKGIKTSSRPIKRKGKIPYITTLPSWNLNTALSREVAFQLNTKSVVLAGGLQASGNTTSSIVMVDLLTHQVKQIGQLMDPTHDASGALLDGKGYIFAGGDATSISAVQEITSGGKALSGGISSGGKGNDRVTASVIGTLPAARSDSSSTTIGSVAYIIGGYSGTAPDGNILSVTTKGKISVVGHLAVPVRYPAVASLDGKIYVFGGQQVVGVNAGQPTSVVQEVNPKTGSVVVIAHLPTALIGAQAVSVGQNIILCGGDESVNPSGTGSQTQSAVWLITPKKWQVKELGNLTTAVSHAAVTVSGNTVWLFGGEKDGAGQSIVQGFRLLGSV